MQETTDLERMKPSIYESLMLASANNKEGFDKMKGMIRGELIRNGISQEEIEKDNLLPKRYDSGYISAPPVPRIDHLKAKESAEVSA